MKRTGRRICFLLALEDGTYWRYDGTNMELYPASILDDANAQRTRERFIEVTNADFWTVMEDYFETAKGHVGGSW